MLATHEGASLKYHHADHLSVRVSTDTSGTPVNQRSHYPFGEVWHETGAAEKWKFTTYERDAESGNDYAMFRSYVNRLGRFNSPDPIAGSVFDPQSLNRYAYVRNDPVNFVDPLGLTCRWGQTSEGPGIICDVTGRSPGVSGSGSVNELFGGQDLFILDYGFPDSLPFDFSGDGPGGDSGKIARLIKSALSQKNLSKCLNKFFGPGTILTNANLPRVDASRDLSGGRAGEVRPAEVPATGRGTVYVDRGLFRSLSATDPYLVATYLHEVANVLAIQRFTHWPDRNTRALLGPRGRFPAENQSKHPWDQDIGQQFEECLYRKD